MLFLQILKLTRNISIDNINKILKKNKFYFSVHFGGLPCDMKSINKLKKNINLLFMRMQRILLELNMIKKTRLGRKYSDISSLFFSSSEVNSNG